MEASFALEIAIEELQYNTVHRFDNAVFVSFVPANASVYRAHYHIHKKWREKRQIGQAHMICTRDKDLIRPGRGGRYHLSGSDNTQFICPVKSQLHSVGINTQQRDRINFVINHGFAIDKVHVLTEEVGVEIDYRIDVAAIPA